MVKQVSPRVGEDVLDIGTGSGEPALTIARLVAPVGRVTGIDLSERMIETAEQASRSSDLPNATFKVMDAEALDLPDGCFDLAVSRFGFQIFTNPERAAREALRVLKPAARLGLRYGALLTKFLRCTLW